MDYNGRLQIICDTLKKAGVQATVTDLQSSVALLPISTLLGVLDSAHPTGQTVEELLGTVEHRTLYKFTDAHQICYIYLRLPDQENSLFLVGPYVTTALSLKKIIELTGNPRLSVKRRSMIEKICAGIPVIPDGSPLYLMLDAFCEYLWEGDFSFHDIVREQQVPASPLHQGNAEDDGSNDILLRMQLMEKRYQYENRLMQAVTLGQINKVSLLSSTLSEYAFEKRSADPLRNMKNYCVIMNTLFRKAAEQGGVHPIYLDSVSSAYAVKIEQTVYLSEINSLMQDIFRAYCRLVLKHSTREYSPLIQNTIVCIDSDLSANLCLRSLATAMKVSPGYLSTAFKRETGKTVTEYIREKRIQHAIHLLSTTHLQIQTVALHCGIMDLQYFSKLFKRHTGMNPKEFRQSLKQ